jgi:hypothetical protein
MAILHRSVFDLKLSLQGNGRHYILKAVDLHFNPMTMATYLADGSNLLRFFLLDDARSARCRSAKKREDDGQRGPPCTPIYINIEGYHQQFNGLKKFKNMTAGTSQTSLEARTGFCLCQSRLKSSWGKGGGGEATALYGFEISGVQRITATSADRMLPSVHNKSAAPSNPPDGHALPAHATSLSSKHFYGSVALRLAPCSSAASFFNPSCFDFLWT